MAFSSLPPRSVTLLILLFFFVCAAISSIIYATGGIGAGSAFGVFMVLCAGAVAGYYVSRSYPADKGFRRSLADTIGFTLVRSLLVGVTVYLALYIAGLVKDLSGSEILVQIVLFVGAWAFATFFLEWFGRKAKAENTQGQS